MTQQDIREKDISDFRTFLDKIRSVTEKGVFPSIEKQLLSILEQAFPSFPHIILTQEFPMLYRLTINRKVLPLGKNKRIRNIKYLKYPPPDKVTRYNRCNLPRQSVLYATIYGAYGHSLVAISEMNPGIGDLITEATWKVKTGQTLTYSPIFMNQPLSGNSTNQRTLDILRLHEQELQTYPENLRQRINLMVRFVADAFTKRINPNNDRDYILSAFFSNRLLHHLEGGIIDAVWYPSVKNDLTAENLAIKPNAFDSKYELCEVKDSVLVAKDENGGSSEALGECKNFNFATGEILWDPKIIRQPKNRVKELRDLFQIQLDEND